MKKIVFAAAALLMFSASAHAATYNVEGVTVHVQDGCRSSACVSVYAPGYGSYHGGHPAQLHKAHKDEARVAATEKEDATPTAAAPAVEATPANTADKTLDKAPDAAAQAVPSDTAPAK
jgi:hypothetical protein